MSAGDFNKKIQGIAKDLCFDPNAPMGPQLQNLSDGIRQMAITIANELDPINTPTPPNLDLPPLDWQMPDLPMDSTVGCRVTVDGVAMAAI